MRYTIEYRTAGNPVWTVTLEDKGEAVARFMEALIADGHQDMAVQHHGATALRLVRSGNPGTHVVLSPGLGGATEFLTHK